MAPVAPEGPLVSEVARPSAQEAAWPLALAAVGTGSGTGQIRSRKWKWHDRRREERTGDDAGNGTAVGLSLIHI